MCSFFARDYPVHFSSGSSQVYLDSCLLQCLLSQDLVAALDVAQLDRDGGSPCQ